jgi:hypothetical protein
VVSTVTSYSKGPGFKSLSGDCLSCGRFCHSRQVLVQYLKLYNDCFLPYSLRFIIYYHFIIWRYIGLVWAPDGVFIYTTKINNIRTTLHNINLSFPVTKTSALTSFLSSFSHVSCIILRNLVLFLLYVAHLSLPHTRMFHNYCPNF